MITFPVDNFRPWKHPSFHQMISSKSARPFRYPTPPSISDTVSPAEPSSVYPPCGKRLRELCSQPGQHPLPARPPPEACAHLDVGSKSMSRSRPLASVKVSPHSDMGRGTPRPTSPSASPVHLHSTSPVADAPKGDNPNRPEPSVELSYIQFEIGTDDPLDGGVDDFEKDSVLLGESNVFPIEPAILSEEDWAKIGLLHSASNEDHLLTIEDLDTNGTLSGHLLDLPPMHGRSQDPSKTGPRKHDARGLVESLPDQRNHQWPARHDHEASMTISGENTTQARGQQWPTSKRLSTEAEGLGGRSAKRPRLDDSPVSVVIGVAHDSRDFSALVNATSPVPLDQTAIPSGEDHETATNEMHRAIYEHDYADMSDQVAGHACSDVSPKPLSMQGTRRSCDEGPAKTDSPSTVDVAHQRRRSTRKMANPSGRGRPLAGTTLSRRPVKPTQKRGRAARAFQTTRTAFCGDEHTFTSLRSQFLSSSFEVRLQFVSFLFEAALGSCMHDSESGSEISTATAADVVDVSDEEEWEVEEIVASRVFRGKLQYQVRWKGCDPDAAWYAAHGFKGAPYKVQTFHDTFPDQPGPPKRLTEWIQSWELGRELRDVPDDDLPR